MTVSRSQAEQSRPSINALADLLERVTPWLVDVGSWIFGGLIALNLVVVAALITVGPVDRSVVLSTVTLACALPLDVTGIVLLRLIKDVEDIRLDDVTLQAFKEAHFPNIEAYFPRRRDRARLRKRRARIALVYAAAIGALSVALTLTGVAAALWHMRPWIAECFSATVVLSAMILAAVAAHALPPESDAEREVKRRYAERTAGQPFDGRAQTEESR